MKFIDCIKRRFFKTKEYSLLDTFGCPECPPQDCPTFLERQVHKRFQSAIQSYNIIVVYGESRQGKTWTIERYCPLQIRIGCNANMTLDQIKLEMLHLVGQDIRKIEHTVTEEYAEGCQASSDIGNEMLVKAGIDASLSMAHKETLTTSYETLDMTRNIEFLNAVKSGVQNRYFVFDNFHYLLPAVQQQFCALLKEFNYQGIKIIIVGVWKDASRITALAPDLVNRCAHIDIGSWKKSELDEVIHKGEIALNIEIDEDAIRLFEDCSANNIGIFKDFVQKYCQRFDIDKTQNTKRLLADAESAQLVAQEVVGEAYLPLHDRLVNLAMPQREKRDSKHMRQKIIISVLRLIITNSTTATSGLSLAAIKSEMDKLSEELQGEKIGISNLTQELGLLHQREENRQTGINYIPLFYFDKANKKLLVLEPTIYEINAYNQEMIKDIVHELVEGLENKVACY